MHLRNVLIGEHPFSPLNVALLDCEEVIKRQNLTDDFLMHCPTALTLKSSTLATAKIPTTSGLELQFWLVESDQISLNLPAVGQGRGSAGESDSFAMEVAAIRKELTEASRRLNWAVSPLRTIDDLRDRSEVGTQLRQLRTRVRTRRALYVPDSSSKVSISNARGTLLLPHGIPAQVQAKVVGLSKGNAVLGDVQLVGTVCDDLANTSFPSAIEMQRPSFHENADLGARLISAMDSGANITLDVIVCLSWVSAVPMLLKFTVPNQPKNLALTRAFDGES